MGSKPKHQEYQAKKGETEDVQTRIAADQMARYKRDYQPLLAKERDMAAQERLAPTYKGIAQADTMQTLTGQSSLALSQGLGQSANIALGAVNQQLQATTAAVASSTKRQADILAAGKGQQYDAGDALAMASRQGASKGLAEASAKQTVRMAKTDAIYGIGMQMMGQGYQNLGETGNFMESQQWRYNPTGGAEGKGAYESRDVRFKGIGQDPESGWG